VRAKILVASLLLSSSLTASLAAPVAAKSGHDGQWRVDIQTSVGKCPPGGQVVVTIKDERVTGIDAGDVEPWGYIDDTSTFVGHFNIGDKVVRANGEVKGQTASGPWSSNTDYCGGRWTARKID
jgi:hypothetical protein